MRRTRILFSCLLAAALAGAGCSGHSTKNTVAPPADPSPAPDSPAGVVRLLEWSWKNRGTTQYEGIFTDDFRFNFAGGDSAGNAYRDVPFERADELATANAAFIGSDSHAAATQIALDFDKTLIALSDDRPGKDPRWHRTVRSRVDLKVTIDRGGGPEVNEVHGYAQFYTVRGDSAAIPPELVARGWKPDSTRWWIDRWDDETLPAYAALAANPTQGTSWGRIKCLFR